MPAPDHQPEHDLALRIVRVLQGAGHEAYFVGGCVRDLCLGRAPQDYDVATSAPPAEVQRLFVHTKPVGRKFGVLLVIERPLFVEVATFRGESDDQPAAGSGQAVPGTTRTDAARRDFTINALFLDPVTGTVRDWVGGEADLRARIIRATGAVEERLAEDPLRLLRAARLAAELDFTIEPATLAAIRAHATQLQEVSAERLREELARLLRPAHAARGFDWLCATGLLLEALPEARPGAAPGVASGDALSGARQGLAQLPADAPEDRPWVVLLQGLAQSVARRSAPTQSGAGAELAWRVLQRLRFSAAQQRLILAQLQPCSGAAAGR